MGGGDTYTRELNSSFYGSIWIDEGDKLFLKPRVNAPLEDFIQRFIHDEWRLPRPRLIISVAGSATDISDSLPGDAQAKALASKKLERFLKRGLVRAAHQRGDTWFLTSGLDGGVTKYLGSAVRALSAHGIEVVTIGISSFGRVQRNDLFTAPEPVGGRVYNIDRPPAAGRAWLNPDHTHFILVGDERSGWNFENKFRTELEDRYHTSGVPLVLVVISGGCGTLEAVHEAVMDRVPIYVVKGTGRCADLLAIGVEMRNQGVADAYTVLRKFRANGERPLWAASEEGIYLRKLRDILVRGTIEVFDLNTQDVSQVHAYLMSLNPTSRRVVRSHMNRGVDSLMQQSGTILGRLELQVKSRPLDFSITQVATPPKLSRINMKNRPVMLAAMPKLAGAQSASFVAPPMLPRLASRLSPVPSGELTTSGASLTTSAQGNGDSDGGSDTPTTFGSGALPPPHAMPVIPPVGAAAGAGLGLGVVGAGAGAGGGGGGRDISRSPVQLDQGKSLADFIRPPPSGVSPNDLLSVFLAKWRLAPPRLIVSIGGGKVPAEIDSQVKAAFSGMIAAAEKADGWVFTSALAKTSAGYAGEAVYGSSVPVIGFASLKRVHGKESMLEKRGQEVIPLPPPPKGAVLDALDPHHTHFVLAGDSKGDDVVVVVDETDYERSRRKQTITAKEKDPGHLVRFRLEEHLSHTENTAIVYMIANGGVKTVSSALRAVRGNVPILVLGGTGRTAGFIERVYHIHKKWQRNEDTEKATDWLSAEGPKLVNDFFPEVKGDRSVILDVLEDVNEVVEDGTIYVVDCKQRGVYEATRECLLRVIILKGTVGVADSDGQTSLMHAAKVGDEDMAARMLMEGELLSTPDEMSLLLAVKHNHHEIAVRIADFVLDTASLPKTPGFHTIFSACDEDGNTTMMWAAYHNMIDILQTIENTYVVAEQVKSGKVSDGGMEIDHTNIFGETALHFAVTGGSVGAARWLLQRDANALLSRQPGRRPESTMPIMSNASDVQSLSRMASLQEEVQADNPVVTSLRIYKSDPMDPKAAQGPPGSIMTPPSSPPPRSARRTGSTTPRDPFGVDASGAAAGSGAAGSPTDGANIHTVMSLMASMHVPDITALLKTEDVLAAARPYYSPYHLALLMWERHLHELHTAEKVIAAEQHQTDPKHIVFSGSHKSFKSSASISKRQKRLDRVRECNGAVALFEDMINIFINANDDDGENTPAKSLANKLKTGSASGKNVSVDVHRGIFALTMFFRWTGVYCLFLLIVVTLAAIMATDFSASTYYLHDDMRHAFMQGSTAVNTFESLESTDDVWGWISGPWSETVLTASASVPLFDEAAGEAPNGVNPTMNVNYPVGRARIRQIRVIPESCPDIAWIPDQDTAACSASYSASIEAKTPFGPGTDDGWQWSDGGGNRLDGEWAAASWFPLSGYVCELTPLRAQESISKLDSLRSNGWIDSQTRAIILSSMHYNARMHQLIHSKFVVEFLASGGIESSHRLMTLRWNPDWAAWDIFTLGLMLALLFANLFLVYQEIMDIREIMETTAGSWLTKLKKYAKGFNLWDDANILLFFLCATWHLCVLTERQRWLADGIDTDKYFDMRRMVQYLFWRRDTVAVYALVCFGKLVKYVQLVPKIGPPLQAVFHTVTDKVIFSFLGFVLLFTLVMSITFYLAFGHDQTGYRTVERSWFSVLRIMFGDIDNSFVLSTNAYGGPSNVGGTAGVLFMLLILAGNLIIMNITIAVIGKAYEESLKVHSQNSWERMLTKLQAENLWSELPMDFHDRYKRKPLDGILRRCYCYVARFFVSGETLIPPQVRLLQPEVVSKWQALRSAEEMAGKPRAQIASLTDQVAELSESMQQRVDHLESLMNTMQHNLEATHEQTMHLASSGGHRLGVLSPKAGGHGQTDAVHTPGVETKKLWEVAASAVNSGGPGNNDGEGVGGASRFESVVAQGMAVLHAERNFRSPPGRELSRQASAGNAPSLARGMSFNHGSQTDMSKAAAQASANMLAGVKSRRRASFTAMQPLQSMSPHGANANMSLNIP